MTEPTKHDSDRKEPFMAFDPAGEFGDYVVVAARMVTVVPNITGDRAELWLCGSSRIISSDDVQDVLNMAAQLRVDIADFLYREAKASK